MRRPSRCLAALLVVCLASAADAQSRRRGFGPTAQERLDAVEEIELALGTLKSTYQDRADAEPALRNWRELPDDERADLWRRFRDNREAEVAALGAVEGRLATLRGTRELRQEHEETARRLAAIRDLAAAGDAATAAECLAAMSRQRDRAFHDRLADLGVEPEGPAPPPRRQAGDAFLPGALWPDASGTHLNAHGGGVLWRDGAYYWFGEHKTAGPGGNSANVGVHCYRSTDLVHWTDEGVALAVSDDPESDIARGSVIERPKVIYNEKTGKFVMWFHLELRGQGYGAARTALAVAD